MKFAVSISVMTLLFSAYVIVCSVYNMFTIHNKHIPFVDRRATDIYRPSMDSSSIFDKNSWSKLHDAAYTDNTKTIKFEIKENGIPVDIEDYYGQTPLWWSSNRNTYEAAACLLTKFNADVNKPDNQGRTPIHVAKSIAMINLLVSHGANIGATDMLGNSLLHVLAREHNIYNADNNDDAQYNANLLKQLFERKYVNDEQINSKNVYGHTPYDIACDYTFGHTKRVFEEAKINKL